MEGASSGGPRKRSRSDLSGECNAFMYRTDQIKIRSDRIISFQIRSPLRDLDMSGQIFLCVAD